MPGCPRRRLAASEAARSCERPSPQELREETADLAAKDLAGVEEVIANRRLAAPQDLGDLLRLAVLHLAQHERGLLLLRQPARDRFEETDELGVLRVAGG